MKQHIVVREYARLTLGTQPATHRPTLDHAYISTSAFAYLCQLMSSFKSSGATLLQLENQQTLCLDNYVGILSTPCGTVIEILPKIADAHDKEEQEKARWILIKMLTVALNLPSRSAAQAALQQWQMPLLEWVMQRFVAELDNLIKRGLRFDYKVEAAEQKFLQGRLDTAKQMRQPAGRRHLFHIQHDVFLPDNAENRLLKSALHKICGATRHDTTWRDSHHLASLFTDIVPSQNIAADLRAWRNTRLMQHYQAIRPWCELVLGQAMPIALKGSTQGISLLFPMEKLFERYVEHHLQQGLQGSDFQIKRQAASQYLCKLEQSQMFLLKPDMLLKQGQITCMVLDSKWKRISNERSDDKFGLQQSDFYQMFAYGHTYLPGKGDLMLIYPQTPRFTGILGPFSYSPNLQLWVTGFDLEKDHLTWPASWQKNLALTTCPKATSLPVPQMIP